MYFDCDRYLDVGRASFGRRNRACYNGVFRFVRGYIKVCYKHFRYDICAFHRYLLGALRNYVPYIFYSVQKAGRIYLLGYCASVIVGSLISESAAWELSDVCVAAMTLINISAVMLLRKK